MNVLDIFYRNVVPEAMSGRIDCVNYYNILFSTKIVDDGLEYQANINDSDLFIPTLMIKNKDLFDSLLIEYVDLAMKFYEDNNFDDDIINDKVHDDSKGICKEKVILTLLFANATVEDFNNPCEFLKKRINFIRNDITSNYDLGYCDSFKGNVFIEITKDIINNETPYQMIIKVISEDGSEFVFPKIKLAISDDIVYIYAIQNKQNERNEFCKKINRILYKIGEGYSSSAEDDIEDLKDVTASFLVALNMCISYLYNAGYNKVNVPSYLIERWNAKIISNSLRIKYRNLDDNESKKIYENLDYLQHNLTNKLVRNFLRLGCHYNNIDILSFPFELDSCLHIFVNDNEVCCNNSLLYETYNLVAREICKKKYRK